MTFTTHAEHFLTRIDRLNTPQAELALALYRDDELLTLVLQLAQLPEGAERVAISLGSRDGRADTLRTDTGPYVIVTRDGKFVTCLGEGMRPHAEHPVISRHKLEHLSGQVEALRSLFADARSGKRRRCDELIKRIAHVGHNITQSEFDDLAVLTPFLGHLYLVGMLRAQQAVDHTFSRLRCAKRLGKRLDPLLKEYWKNVWAMSHFMMLTGEDPRHAEQFLESKLQTCGLRPERALNLLFPSLPWQTGLLPIALRGFWLTAQMPKTFLKPFKTGFADVRRRDEVYTYGGSLTAIGHRHARYRAEVAKFMCSASTRSGGDELTRAVAEMYDLTFRMPEMFTALVRFDSQSLFDKLADECAPTPATKAYMLGLPDSVKLAMFLNLPIPTFQDEEGAARGFTHLPTIAKLQARDFYLPTRERDMLFKQGYSHGVGLAYANPRLALERMGQRDPVQAPVLPGRNESCACGSGRKFKRCCQGQPFAASALDLTRPALTQPTLTQPMHVEPLALSA